MPKRRLLPPTTQAGEFIQMMRKGFLARLSGSVSGELASNPARPPWSPSVAVVHQDRGPPDEERRKNVAELRKAEQQG